MKTVNITANASGAARGARQGDLVIIVDVINMSTTAEGALEAGALGIFGAASSNSHPPEGLTNPERVGYLAGLEALKNRTEIVLITEPRIGSDEERRKNALSALRGVERAGAVVGAILPNIGAETVKMTSLENKVILLVTDCGGVAFDAALNNGSPLVLTGTIARTLYKKGTETPRRAAAQAIKKAQELDCAITVAAASSNALEDVLGAEYIARTILELGFLQK